ncbi:MAG: radical SAM protein [Planctomycetota bacterium]|nr:radical SAM protein [Planctomycetota bacterium]
MVRIVLVQPPHRDTFGYSMPPLGLLHLGAAARDRGHEPILLDLALFIRRGEIPADDGVVQACVEKILGEKPEAIGIGAMISSMPVTLLLARKIKARDPTLPILLGGQGPETIEDSLLNRHHEIDAIAIGEAEKTFVQWLEQINEPESWIEIAGLAVRDAQGQPVQAPPRPLATPLDEVPSPAWDLAESPRDYAQAAGDEAAMFPIDIGRGCSYNCSFCTTPGFWGRTARHLSPSRAVDEFDALAALGDVDCAYITHDLFTFDRQRVLDFCEEKKARGNCLEWECRTRIDLVDEELLAAMAEAGCRRILYGVESASPEVLRLVNKGGLAESGGVDVLQTLNIASELGLSSILGLMVGIPGESSEDVEANLQLMARAGVIDGVSLSLHWFNVTPGNGQADGLENSTVLLPGITADLVRGYDMPPGKTPEGLADLVASDPEIFAAFRVLDLPHLDPPSGYFLTRHAHVALEIYPRSLRLAARDSSLAEVLLRFFDAADHQTLPDLEPTDWAEPGVLDRKSFLHLLRSWLIHLGEDRRDEMLLTLLKYETTLWETTGPSLLRLDQDPTLFIRSMDEAAALPDAMEACPVSFLFVREGEMVKSRRISSFLADVFEGIEPEKLNEDWPEAKPRHIEQAREILEQLAPT